MAEPTMSRVGLWRRRPDEPMRVGVVRDCRGLALVGARRPVRCCGRHHRGHGDEQARSQPSDEAAGQAAEHGSNGKPPAPDGQGAAADALGSRKADWIGPRTRQGSGTSPDRHGAPRGGANGTKGGPSFPPQFHWRPRCRRARVPDCWRSPDWPGNRDIGNAREGRVGSEAAIRVFTNDRADTSPGDCARS